MTESVGRIGSPEARAAAGVHTEEWRPGALLSILMVALAVTTLVFWLPTVRGLLDGPAYQWSNFGFGGRGTTGDYWFPVAGTVGTLAAFWLGWRGGRFPVHLVLVGWFGLLATVMVHLSLTTPEAARFRGDTLGVDISLVWVGPLVFCALAILAAVWALRDLRSRRVGGSRRAVPPWARRNSLLLGIAAILLPVQVVLLGQGPIHGSLDQVGVVLVLVQWFVLALALRPVPSGPGAGAS